MTAKDLIAVIAIPEFQAAGAVLRFAGFGTVAQESVCAAIRQARLFISKLILWDSSY
jgi:hypothetical protein